VAQAEAESARALLQRIKKGEVTNPFIVRDVYRKGWTHLAKSDQVREAVKLLCAHDYLREESSDTDGRPKTEIWINSKVLA
jgi:hypothetical protein